MKCLVIDVSGEHVHMVHEARLLIIEAINTVAK